MRKVVLLGVLALAACAGRPQTSGNSEGGVTSYSGDQAVYFRRAQNHCAQYGKQARVTYIAPYSSDAMGGVSFECVKG